MANNQVKENEVVKDEKQSNFQVNLEIDFCKKKLQGVYDVRTEGAEKVKRLLVAPSQVSGEADVPSKIPDLVNEMAKDLNGFGTSFDVSKIKDSVDHIDFIKDLTVELNQVFLYKETHDASTEMNRSEYAFAITVANKESLDKTDVHGLRLNSIAINLWNTKREKVIDKMNLMDIDALLKEL